MPVPLPTVCVWVCVILCVEEISELGKAMRLLSEAVKPQLAPNT